MNTDSLHISRTIGILVVVGIVLVGAAAYLMMKKPAPADDVVTISGDPVSESESNFVMLAGELNSIVFETRVFTDSRFLSLKDIHTNILPETQGRTDPFGPIGR